MESRLTQPGRAVQQEQRNTYQGQQEKTDRENQPGLLLQLVSYRTSPGSQEKVLLGDIIRNTALRKSEVILRILIVRIQTQRPLVSQDRLRQFALLEIRIT